MNYYLHQTNRNLARFSVMALEFFFFLPNYLFFLINSYLNKYLSYLPKLHSPKYLPYVFIQVHSQDLISGDLLNNFTPTFHNGNKHNK